VTARVSPSERVRAQIDDLIAGAERGSLAGRGGQDRGQRVPSAASLSWVGDRGEVAQ
jgi:hypothetical protein